MCAFFFLEREKETSYNESGYERKGNHSSFIRDSLRDGNGEKK